MSGADQRPPTGAPGALVKLLWTGGWDSTFRLLSLVTSSPCRIQPYYILNRARPSWPIEIERIEQIWAACQTDRWKYPGSILPPMMVEKNHLEPDAAISLSFRRIAQRAKISPQCEWLAWFAKQYGLDDLEIGVERDAITHRLIRDHLVLETVPVRRYALKPDVDEDLALFRPFRFPLLDLIKSDMATVASKQGFNELLEQAWFCYRPFGNRWPCGMCVPCRYTIYEGLGRRVGWRGRICFYSLGPLTRMMPEAVKGIWRRHLPYLLGRPPPRSPVVSTVVRGSYRTAVISPMSKRD